MSSWLFWDNQPVGEDLQPQLFGTYGSVLFGCLSVNSAPTAEVLVVAVCPGGNSLVQSRALEEVQTELGFLVGKASLQKRKRDVRFSGFGKTGILLITPCLPVK